MIHANKRKVNLLLLLAACVFISMAATKPTAAVTPGSAPQDTGLYKNLKVLPKNITKDSLDKIMRGFTRALGVKCNFCHAMKDGHPDFPSEDKPEKDVARYMMEMTRDINARHFNMENSTRPDTLSVVKCITCHHGSPHPDAAAVPASPPPGQAPPPPPPLDSAKKMQPPTPQQQ